MSMDHGAALQAALFDTLSGAPALGGVPVFETPPAGEPPRIWVRIGEGRVEDASDASGPGAVHWPLVTVQAEAGALHEAKEAAGSVSILLTTAPPAMPGLRGLTFVRARSRVRGARREIEMTFRARIEG